MEQTGKKKVDAILLLAKASFTGRRRPSLLMVLVCLAVLLAGMGALVWYFWPRPSLPQLILVAFDQVALPNEEVTVAAALEPAKPVDAERSLAGCPLFFQDLSTGDRLGAVKTDVQGTASVMKALGRAPVTTEIMVRYPGEPDRQKGDESKASIFVWPPESTLLIVDVLQTVMDADASAFHGSQNLDLRPRAGAAAALRSVPAKYRVVYVGRGMRLPSDYRKLKAWLEQSAGLHDRLPTGPVLRVAEDESDSDGALGALISNLRKRFAAEGAAITGSTTTARLFQEQGLKTYLVGDGKEVDEGVTRVKSWNELANRIAK